MKPSFHELRVYCYSARGIIRIIGEKGDEGCNTPCTFLSEMSSLCGHTSPGRMGLQVQSCFLRKNRRFAVMSDKRSLIQQSVISISGLYA